jgi:Cu/Ag efflux pump CusA
MAILGMVTMVGVVINNAIVLVSFINSRREAGIDIAEACLEAGPNLLSNRWRAPWPGAWPLPCRLRSS